MTSCREFLQLWLDSWLDGELSRLRQRQCNAHLEHCRSCKDYAASYGATRRLLDQFRPLAPPMDVGEDFVRGS